MIDAGWMILVIVLLCAISFWYFRRGAERQAFQLEEYTAGSKELDETLKVLSFVKQSLHELSRNQLEDYGLSEEAYKRKRNQRAELRQALKGCVSGDLRDKLYVKNYISRVLESGYPLSASQMNRIIPFDEREKLTAQDQFDILLYLYKQRHGNKALSTMIEEYRLDSPKTDESSEGDFRYEIDAEAINHIFYMEYRELEEREKLELIVQRVYQIYKGFSVVDEIRDQGIDGVSGGVSGSDYTNREGVLQQVFEQGWEGLAGPEASGERNFDSVWIFYRGKSIRLSFLSFGSEGELKRVCQNIYKYNLPGQLSEASAYKVNEMKDGSRVVVVRPPFAESWAFFVRKFDIGSASLEQLIKGEGAETVIFLLQFLMKGARITAVTGSQGAGKTTLLMALIKSIYGSYTLRIQEMSFELHLRRLYPNRNILTFRETDHISGQQGLDLQKKTDGAVNILGEVATDEVAAWMIQMSQVASLFTVFTHHAKTFADLIHALRNSLLKSGLFRDELTAEKQVIRAIHFDVHLRHDMDGSRYIERITECVPVQGPIDHSGQAGQYEARDIVVYSNGKYEVRDTLSEQTRRDMRKEMVPADAIRFDRFLADNWGEQLGA
ncbi:pilus assembly protein CpaF [Paenibacillus yonginensis]|uniref:Pilus assembly protein CpaF n=1 Tax=Paenibacillus yonginensis TaxID=1462996 RepID=A0A1B1MZN6_9BACL|nr:Flp pilus assembly complex ATPase component TadA [Paenibacillus yonginensis]ANS74631.1 pilus assembly protein CpaF [Paenibacillus yonginensis]